MNNPLHRYCDRCWNLHPSWLPEQLLSLQRKGCSCTSWSQDHKNHIASARTQAWAEHVNKSLSRRDVSESATLEFDSTESGSTAADACQDVIVVVPPSHTHSTAPVELTLSDANAAANNVAQSSGMCVICLTRPKEASIIHGNTGHQVCCYICAKRLQHRRMSCPVCRRPISGVIRNYLL